MKVVSNSSPLIAFYRVGIMTLMLKLSWLGALRQGKSFIWQLKQRNIFKFSDWNYHI